MTEKNEKQFVRALEVAKKLYQRELTSEEKDAIRKQYDNEIAKSVDFRAGETDLTHLKQGEINQILIRNQFDVLAYLKFMNETLNDFYCAFAYYLKKNGVDDPFKEIEDFSSEEYAKLNKGE